MNQHLPRRLGAIAGLVSGGFAVAIGIATAAVLDTPSPIDAVGSSFIDRTPAWLKEWAIQTFGTADKAVLRGGIFAVLAVASAILGATGVDRLRRYVSGAVVFGILGSVAIAERPGHGITSHIAPWLGIVSGAVAYTVATDRWSARWWDRRTPHESRAPLGWDRRRFFRTTATIGAAAAATGIVGRVVSQQRRGDYVAAVPNALPAVDDPSTPLIDEGFHPTEPFVTPAGDFYRIDTALSIPYTTVDKWSLSISGLVDQPLVLTYDDLVARPQVERMITICCVSNEVGGRYVGNAVWQGVLLADLLDEVGVKPEAEQLFSRSLDGWTSGFPIEVARDGRDAMIAIGMNGDSLPFEHGFPARLIVPGLYGYVSATKWLSSIELTTWADDVGYWVPLGWSRLAPIKTQSRIDVPRIGERVPAGRFRLAGVAWATHTGIERVEVRIDEGEWRVAELSRDVSDDTWRQWVLDWDATPGEHRVTVRATDRSGYVQTSEQRAPAPDGATGWHSRKFTVTD
ncbi:MAG: molybdopterin-dependent oxidoreductase [Actinomycetota bacterium]